jgi:hypothetical protein
VGLSAAQESLDIAEPLAATSWSIETVDAPTWQSSQGHEYLLRRPVDRRPKGPPVRGCERSANVRTRAR